MFLTFNAFFKPPIVPNKSNTLHHPYPHFPYNSQQNQPCDEIVARNCLGAGRAPKARAIEKLGQKENPDIVFPFETKAHAPRIKKFQENLRFGGSFSVDVIGKAGGLPLF